MLSFHSETENGNLGRFSKQWAEWFLYLHYVKKDCVQNINRLLFEV